MVFVSDPISDYETYSAREERELERLPKCSECGEPIQSGYCYEFDSELICPDCMTINHRRWVEDFIKEK